MKKNILLTIMVLCSAMTMAQGKYYVSTSQQGERFEIVQSPIVRADCFKLDKYRGRVYQIAKTKDDNMIWEYVEVEDLDTINQLYSVNDSINYQLFMGGMVRADCYLLHVRSGATWVLVKRSDDTTFFQKMETYIYFIDY